MDYKYNLTHDKFDDRDYLFAHAISPTPTLRLPSTVDLRYKCPPVYNQGENGSCSANAGCACRSMLANQSRLSLSRLYLYHVARSFRGDEGEDSGASIREICKALNKYGVCEEQYMPYGDGVVTEEPSSEAEENAPKFKTRGYRKLESLKEIKQNLALRQQPVLAGMDVYESFLSDRVASGGYMPMPKPNEKNLGGHAVLIVGYKDSSNNSGGGLGLGSLLSFSPPKNSGGYLIVRNSWGNSWGEHGYFYMPYQYVNRGFAYDFWTIE